MRMAMSYSGSLRLVAVPSDQIAAYERKGLDWLERYYNPQGMFKEVFVLSPFEKGVREAYGMTIIGVKERDFVNMLRKLHPDVVRGYGGYWASDLVCSRRLANIPVIVSVHDTNPRNIHKSVCYADLVICTSNIVAKKVIEYGTDTKRVRVLPNRVDTAIFRPIRDKYLLQPISERFPKGKYILHVGRKSKEKNLDTLICSLPLLPKEYHCIFVGQGDIQPYKTLAQSLCVDDRCFWIESIKNSELPMWYSWCDCMCLPSRWEGFGVVFIEAAACGTPIITSDIAPMNEYLTHNASAYLVKEYENPKAVAMAILRICEDDEYSKSITQGALQAVQPFDRRVVDAQEAAIYREAIELGSLFLFRQLEIKIWKVQERIRSLVVKASPKRIVRVVRNKAWFKVVAYTIKKLILSCQYLVITIKYHIFGKKINRNQWNGENSRRWEIYGNLMIWTWEETQKKASSYFKRLNFSISKASGKVLEIGCGIGTMTRWLATSSEVEHIWAIDGFEDVIEKLRDYNLPNVTPCKMSFDSIKFDSAIIFDTIMICEVLEHLYIDEEVKMLHALFNYINSETRYVISVPIGWLPDKYHVRGFSKEGLKKHLRKFYGEPIEVDYSSGYSQVAWGYFRFNVFQ